MLYIKNINGLDKISLCKTIQANDGTWICNPTEEEIFAAGWVVYTPQELEEIEYIKQDPDYLDIISAVKTMLKSQVDNLSDELALEVAALYPTWNSNIGKSVTIGQRLWYNDKLYKVIQSHIVLEDWTPDKSVSLFTEVTIEEWPEFVQPTGQHDAYMTGDQITYNGKHYISLMDYNVWSPDTSPLYWNEVTSNSY